MSQFIAPQELEGMTLDELRALHRRITSDLSRTSKFVSEAPHVMASLASIEIAIARLQQLVPARPPRGPRL
jgi:hypothetical protein